MELGTHRLIIRDYRWEDWQDVHAYASRPLVTYEGYLREHMFHKGKWHDSLQYSILEHEFKG